MFSLLTLNVDTYLCGSNKLVNVQTCLHDHCSRCKGLDKGQTAAHQTNKINLVHEGVQKKIVERYVVYSLEM